MYSEGLAQAVDFQESYLAQLLGFITITNIDLIHSEGYGLGAEPARKRKYMKSAG